MVRGGPACVPAERARVDLLGGGRLHGHLGHWVRHRAERVAPAAQEAMAPWRQGLERRAEIDRRISAIRALALHDLSRAALEGRAQ